MIAQKMLMSGGGAVVVITASVRSPDIAALARTKGWNGTGPITLIINSGVDVATLSVPSSIPSGILTIINNGRIGGIFNGGTALTVRAGISVINYGQIFGGGGRGGNGAWKTIFRSSSYSGTGGGGSGGDGAGFSQSGAVTMYAAALGASGSSESVGGPSLGGQTQGVATGGRGGDGGGIGEAGSDGNYGSTSGTYERSSDGQLAAGGRAGNYIDGNSYVTWQTPGTRLGNAI